MFVGYLVISASADLSILLGMNCLSLLCPLSPNYFCLISVYKLRAISTNISNFDRCSMDSTRYERINTAFDVCVVLVLITVSTTVASSLDYLDTWDSRFSLNCFIFPLDCQLRRKWLVKSSQ